MSPHYGRHDNDGKRKKFPGFRGVIERAAACARSRAGCHDKVRRYSAVARLRVRRGGRVAEGARLESVYTGNRIVGSNPTLSASAIRNPFSGPWQTSLNRTVWLMAR